MTERESNIDRDTAVSDPIETVIKENKLNLKFGKPTPAVGNCWWEGCIENMNQIGLLVPGITTAKDLRIAVVNSIKDHPLCKSHWLPIAFGNDTKKLRRFLKAQKKDGEYTDENGVIALATSLFLNVQINIIAPDNNSTNPFTAYNKESNCTDVFWMAHYPTNPTTGFQGHFQTLVKKSSTHIPPMWRSPESRPQQRTTRSKRIERPVDPEYRQKVSDFAAKNQLRQKQVAIRKEQLRQETRELIKKTSGANIKCPDCQILCHRGRGLVNHRLNHCKVLKRGTF